MSWTERTNSDIQIIIDKLIKKADLHTLQRNKIIELSRKMSSIQTIKKRKYDEKKKESVIVSSVPKDFYGEDMTGEFRLSEKEKCITLSEEYLSDDT